MHFDLSFPIKLNKKKKLKICAKPIDMQSNTQTTPKLAFKAQVAIRLRNIDTPMTFSWFLLASRLSIKLHNAKHLRLAWETWSVSPPWMRTGILCSILIYIQRRWCSLKDFLCRKESTKDFHIEKESWLLYKEFVLKTLLQKIWHRKRCASKISAKESWLFKRFTLKNLINWLICIIMVCLKTSRGCPD